jgi:hypothetical protein
LVSLRKRRALSAVPAHQKTVTKFRSWQGVGRWAREKAKIKMQRGKTQRARNAKAETGNEKRRTRSAWGQTERVGCTAQCGGFICLG